ncbi:2-oxo acid dehydrogenase subunit E2 [Porticoccaceae bacterium]|nr:2-oxo acid dehydrogenase subunit E2 [Porticoccaceae bacterium]
MKKEFILPDIGEGIVECEVIEWKVREGDLIEEDQIVVDVSTDKAIVEIPSMYNGRITKLHHATGDIAQVHSPLFAIEVENTSESDLENNIKNNIKSDIENSEARKIELQTEPVAIEAQSAKTQQAAPDSSKVLTTPAVRKMAREHQLDLGTIPGTGKQGRVLKEDVLGFLAQDKVAGTAPSGSVGNLTTPAGVVAEDRVEIIRGVGKIMAQRMTESVASIPHFTFVDELDVTELMQLRRNLNEQHGNEKLKITLMPLFIKALSLALKAFPIINSRANSEFTELTYLASHNIGMAVDGANGLLVPNIKAVEQRSILDIAAQVMDLTAAARSGKINPADLKGGSITISNIGAIGGTVATPIINKPELAIVALGKIQRLPRFDQQGNVVPRNIMTVSWSGDHRVIDGGTIARFNNCWKGYLEQPATMLGAMV